MIDAFLLTQNMMTDTHKKKYIFVKSIHLKYECKAM